jgi:hypothetical protein
MRAATAITALADADSLMPQKQSEQDDHNYGYRQDVIRDCVEDGGKIEQAGERANR